MENQDNDVGKALGNVAKKAFLKGPLLPIIIGSFLFFLIIICTTIMIFQMFSEEAKDDKLNDAQEKFRTRVNKVSDDIKSNYSVEVDKALLVATLMYAGDYDMMYDEDVLGEDAEALFAEGVDFGTFFKSGSEKFLTWCVENVLNIPITPEGKELKKYRSSAMTMYIVGAAMVNQGKLDLEAFRKNLETYIVPWLYPIEVLGGTKPRSIADDIFALAEMYRPWFPEQKKKNNCGVGSSCTYDVEGQSISNLKVRPMKCADEGRGTPVEGEELIDFEKYVLGVAYAEIGPDSPAEAQKAEAIAARSYALMRAKAMGNAAGVSLKEEDGQWILSLRNCTEDQVYCDPDQGCYASGNNTGNTVHSGNNGTGQVKPPLPADASIRTAVAETNGKVLLNASNEIIQTSYLDTDQRAWIRMAENGKEYTEILIEHYNSVRAYGASSISTSNCITGNNNMGCIGEIGGAASGPFTGWKQSGAPWSGLRLGGGDTVDNIGCLVTSIAIQMARSGVVTDPLFNPGTLVEQLNGSGGFVDGGNLVWGSITNLYPQFQMGEVNRPLNGMNAVSGVQSMISQGCYVVLNVRNGGHWVAVDRVEGDTIWMMDPGRDATNVNTEYGLNSIQHASCYKKAG